MRGTRDARAEVSVAAGAATPGPTPGQLRCEIDAGLTGDKVEQTDPAVAPLGSDDEVAGRPPTAGRVALARYHELFRRWSGVPFRNRGLRGQGGWALPFLIGFTGLVGVVFLVALAALGPHGP